MLNLLFDGVIIAGLVGLFYLVYRLHKNSSELSSTMNSQVEQTLNTEHQLAVIHNMLTPIEIFNDDFDSPIPGSSLVEMSFQDFFSISDSSVHKAIEMRNAERMVAKILRYAGYTDFVSHGWQIIKSIQHVTQQNKYVVEFTKEAITKLDIGALELVPSKSTGFFKAMLRDATTKKFTNIADIVAKTKSNDQIAREILSNASTGIIAIAHIISNYDMSKKLVAIGRQLDYLMEGRMIDKVARLQANFHHLQHILKLDNNQRATQLLLIHKDLMELRYNWALEVEYGINSIKDDRILVSKWLGFSDKDQDRKTHKQLCEMEQRLLLIGCSLKIDALASSLCSVTINKEHELIGINRIENLVDEKYKKYNYEGEAVKTKQELNEFFSSLKNDCSTLLSIPSDSHVINAEYVEVTDY